MRGAEHVTVLFFFVFVEAVFVRADMVSNTHSVPESVGTGNID